MKYKIIGTSNFDNDTVSDILVCENMSLYFANKIFEDSIKQLNTNTSTYYYKVVPQDHKLYEWEP